MKKILVLLGLILTQTLQGGGVSFSINLGFCPPVYVQPYTPVYVQPVYVQTYTPVIVQSAPVIVQPVPVIVQPAPLIIQLAPTYRRVHHYPRHTR